MRSGISVTITRERLVELRACDLDLFDAVAPSGVLHIAEWTQLHDAWLSLSEHAGWLIENRLVPRASLRRANLRGADLTGANLRGADLTGANMRVAVLYGAYLYGADLRRANLRGANLCDAYLCDAYLSGANLTAANLCGANLRGADLTGAIRGKSDAEVPGWSVVDGRMVACPRRSL